MRRTWLSAGCRRAEQHYVAQYWGDTDWKLDREQMLEELSASWVRLLS
ncbi:hypothetical protein [Streptomyces thermodiastaticus]|nr:hypothetical protein [Streptomyces thermodiastaticus]MCE7549291.1 hypothetical protein [Streptomyces thermodiastaticus]GHF61610.1 hypothetical protein GCM10018787_07370 [Streptomyces thermodiastaticus]